MHHTLHGLTWPSTVHMQYSTSPIPAARLHDSSVSQDPAARLATIAAAGQAQVPFTSGILVGIGETRAERIEALLVLKAIHQQHGHIQVL